MTEFKRLSKYHQVNLTKYLSGAYYQFVQFIFIINGFHLKNTANDKGIKIISDMPFYIQSRSSVVG